MSDDQDSPIELDVSAYRASAISHLSGNLSAFGPYKSPERNISGLSYDRNVSGNATAFNYDAKSSLEAPIGDFSMLALVESDFEEELLSDSGGGSEK